MMTILFICLMVFNLVLFHSILFYIEKKTREKKNRLLVSLFHLFEDENWGDYQKIMKWRKANDLRWTKKTNFFPIKTLFPYLEDIDVLDIIPNDEIGKKFQIFVKDRKEYQEQTTWSPF